MTLKNARLQKDINGIKRYTITPHIRGGFITPDDIIRIGEVAKKYNASLRINANQNIAIYNFKEEDLENIWDELDMNPTVKDRYAISNIQICSSNFCKASKLPTIGIGMKIYKAFYGYKVGAKTKIAVSGCKNACTNAYAKDIGILVDDNQKFFITVGGKAGLNPKKPLILFDNLSENKAFDITSNLLKYYSENGLHNEKIGDFVQRIGLDTVKEKL